MMMTTMTEGECVSVGLFVHMHHTHTHIHTEKQNKLIAVKEHMIFGALSLSIFL